MHLENFFAAQNIGVRNNDLTVKTSWSQQGRVQHIRTVRRSNQDHTLIGLKTIHFNKELVKSLFAFVITAAETGTAMPTNGVNFVNKDDAGRIFLTLFKHIPDPRCANTDKHFNKVRTRNRKERHIGFTSNGTGQQRLTSAWRANQQYTFGNFSAQTLEFLWVA